MHFLETFSGSVRHSRFLRRTNRLWDVVRPIYNRCIALVYRKGLRRVMNGTDVILVSPRLRGLPEEYEPEVWRSVMNEVTSGDVVADVGSHIGLYAIALAQRVGPTGRVFAFEPDPENFEILAENAKLNTIRERIELLQTAVGDVKGPVYFSADGESVSHILERPTNLSSTVECVTLDDVFGNERMDLLKVDVEGYEERVLRGASNLLGDRSRGPRSIYLEVHPYAWAQIGTTSESLLGLLHQLGYGVQDIDGQPVERITEYGEVVAVRNNSV
jgi:FkbM family methyltransferase